MRRKNELLDIAQKKTLRSKANQLISAGRGRLKLADLRDFGKDAKR